MKEHKKRRTVLKALGISATAGSGLFPVTGKAGPTGKETEQPEELEPPEIDLSHDIELKNIGEEESNVQVRFVPTNGEGPERRQNFAVPPIDVDSVRDGLLPIKKSQLDISGGDYRLIVESHSGKSKEVPITIPDGGLSDHEVIIVRDEPEESINVIHTIL